MDVGQFLDGVGGGGLGCIRMMSWNECLQILLSKFINRSGRLIFTHG
jgi:hypothetical protein